MKRILLVLLALLANVAFAVCKVCVPGVDGMVTNTYDLSSLSATDEVKSAKDYIGAYADNVQHDPEFKTNEATALKTVQSKNKFFGTWWAVLPAIIAIVLALISKEVYSSLFVGILTGGLLYSGFSFEGTLVHVITDGIIASLADAYNIGIVVFFILLGALVSMMNRTGASAASRHWAEKHIHSRVGAQVATIVLGLLVFVDDAFNNLTVGSVMRPVTDAKGVSRAKLAYLIDSTSAPICIIAPISSWAAAVAGFAKGAGAENGFALFVASIPYNFYALLTIVMLFCIAIMKFDFGSMKKYEDVVIRGEVDESAIRDELVNVDTKGRGGVIDLVIPMVVLVVCCVIGLIYSGGYFGDSKPSLIQAFGDSDAAVGLVFGTFVTIVFSVVFYQCRRVVGFRECMEALPEGFKLMVPAALILTSAWTLKAMTDSLGAKVFISDLINGPAASLVSFLPAIVFVIAVLLAFSTGTSWGTFGILIPIVLAAIPGSQLTIIAVSACMAGAVCGDHCSPISDTTIVSAAGAQCDHIVHVRTQIPYALVVAGVSFVTYIIAPFVVSPWICIPLGVVFLIGTLLLMRIFLEKQKSFE